MRRKSIRVISLITGLLLLMALLQVAGNTPPPSFESSDMARLHGWGERANVAATQANGARLTLVLLAAGVALGALGFRRIQLKGFTCRYALLAAGSLVWLAGVISFLLSAGQPAVASEVFRTNIPNGDRVYTTLGGSCQTCHGPGSPEPAPSGTPGYLAALLKPVTGPGNQGAWFGKGATIAPLDTDGDGFTNGEELQDPAGAWVWNANNAYGDTQYVANPNSTASLPPLPQITALLGIANGQTLSGSFTVNPNLRYAGLTKVVYEFKNSSGATVLSHTVNSSSPTNYANKFCLHSGSSSMASPANCPAWNSAVLPNGVYSLVVTAFDKRAAGLGGPRTTSLTRTNLTVNNLTSHNPTVFTDDRIDNNDCTLREAIIAANTNSQVDLCLPGSPGHDTIQLQGGTYQLSVSGPGENAALTGDLDITESLTIYGPGAIDGGDLDRVFEVSPLISVTLSGVTLKNGATVDGGGGITNWGILTIINSTINDNTTTGNGGGIRNHLGALTLINSTVSGNLATGFGGGIANDPGTVNLYNATIARNRANSDSAGGGAGGGLFNDSGSTLNLQNTIVADNRVGLLFAADDDCYGALNSQGYNLVEIWTNCIINADATNIKANVDPKLGSLANNGGPTKTHALSSDSPVIDRGNPNGCTDKHDILLTGDQRGYGRPVDGDSADGARCDLGAFEFGAVANTPPTISNIPDASTNFNTPTAPIPFTINDTQTPADNLTLSGGSANQTLVPNANISFGGSGASRTVTITPAAGQNGITTITIIVSDGVATSSDSFVLTVNPAAGDSVSHIVYLPIVLRR